MSKTFTQSFILTPAEVKNNDPLRFSQQIRLAYPAKSVTINATVWSATGATYRTYVMKSNIIPHANNQNVFNFAENSSYGPIVHPSITYHFDRLVDFDNYYTFSFHDVNGTLFNAAGDNTNVTIRLVFECVVT